MVITFFFLFIYLLFSFFFSPLFFLFLFSPLIHSRIHHIHFSSAFRTRRRGRHIPDEGQCARGQLRWGAHCCRRRARARHEAQHHGA
jgi:hypothetical protein